MLSKHPVKMTAIAKMQQIADLLDLPGCGYQQNLCGVNAHAVDLVVDLHAGFLGKFPGEIVFRVAAVPG